MRKGMDAELKVGIFVAIGVAITIVSILVLGSTEDLFTRKNKYSVHFKSVEGLIQGAKVVLSGIKVGTVENVGFDLEKQNIKVEFSVEKETSTLLRQDATAEIETQGVLGDKYVAIFPGDSSKPVLPPGSDIPDRPSTNITGFISKGDQLLASLNSLASNLDRVLSGFQAANRSEIFFAGMASTAHNLSLVTDKLNRQLEEMNLGKASKNLNAILEKVNNGTGTLGALVNDPSLYDSARSLVGGANRSRIMRNLVRQTIKESDKAEEQVPGAQASPVPHK
jgi:phospholipid/cholesterol/gamma-HCH transport system substrate-binding protein